MSITSRLTGSFRFTRGWRMFIVLAMLVSLLGMPSGHALAGTTSLEATADTYMNSSSGKGNLNYGGSTTIQANPYNPTGGGKQYKGILMQWDLTSIPAGMDITSASITFHVTDASVFVYNLYAMRRAWVEGTNDATPGTGASWNYYGAGTGSWAIDGVQDTLVDRYDTNLWTVTTDTFSATGNVTIPLNAAGIAVIQAWIDGGLANNGLTMQNYSEGRGDTWIAASSENATYAGPTLNLTYIDPPVITTTGALSSFSTKPGIASAGQTYTVSGNYLIGDLNITAPEGFELSTDGVNYSSSLVLPQSGGNVAATTIHIRLNSATEGDYSGNIAHSSSGATTVNIATSGAVIANRAPVITEGETTGVSISEDGAPTPFSVILHATDADADETLTWSIGSNPAHGTAGVIGTGISKEIAYIPEADFHGTDSFAVEVTDNSLATDSITITVTIEPINDTPVANDQAVSTDEDIDKAITLTASDIDGDTLTWDVGTPTHGSLSGTAPNLTYTPDADYNGSDSFTFKVNDGSVDSSLATVSITVNAVNDAPVADSQSVTTDEDVEKAIDLTGSDVENDSLTYSVVDLPTHGTLTGAAPNLVYTPYLNFNGADSFTFKASDGSAESTLQSVNITVNAVNDTPIADGQDVSTDEDTALPVALTGSDVETVDLTYTVVDGPAHGNLSGIAPDLTYTPDADFNGGDSFTFKVNDGSVDSALATISITVNAVNDAPVADSQSVTTDEDVEKAIDLTGSDVENDSLIFTVIDLPSHGTLTGAAPNLVYTPYLNFNGADSFTFKVSDGSVESALQTVNITVNAVNDIPTADGQDFSTDEDTAILVALTGSDVETDGLVYAVVDSPAHGELSGVAPDLTYTPDADFNGGDSFTFKVNDGSVDSSLATVSITVNAVNDAPVADDQTLSVLEEFSLPITLTAGDVEADMLAWEVNAPSHGALYGTAPELTYIPEAGYTGGDTFTFKVSDGKLDSNIATIHITVTEKVSSDLVVELSDGLTEIEAGKNLTYVISVTNSGANAVPGATVTLTLPESLENISWTCVGTGGGTCTTSGSGAITDTVDLPTGANITYTVNAKVKSTMVGDMATTASVTVPAVMRDTNLANNTASDTDRVQPTIPVTSGRLFFIPVVIRP